MKIAPIQFSSRSNYRAGIILCFIALISMGSGCHSKPTAGASGGNRPKEQLEVPTFNPDSAYQYIDKQVAFGPRVPNTPEHAQCAKWLETTMRQMGAEVLVQEGRVKAFDNNFLHIKNIIASFQPEKNNRILLFAHWDSRPFSDHDPDPTRHNHPIDGANDGASGVGVLMEVGRQLGQHPTHPGIDIIFFDAEDYGQPDHLDLPYQPDTWCLGSQYWGKNPHQKDYYARYGILLDMVGAPGATFYQEQGSLDMAPHLVDLIWNTAAQAGYSSYFVFDRGGRITDDHVYVNKHLGIPCVDIIQYDPTSNSSFGSYWHTHNDTMENINRETLKAVGQTLLEVLYRED